MKQNCIVIFLLIAFPRMYLVWVLAITIVSLRNVVN